MPLVCCLSRSPCSEMNSTNDLSSRMFHFDLDFFLTVFTGDFTGLFINVRFDFAKILLAT